MDEFFAPGGLFEQRLEGYEQRQSQTRMATAVFDALERQNHLIVEAGTGTGKTMAYLLPALMIGHRILVSTGTKTLQDQIFYKDIPLLEKVLGRTIRAAYLKGRNNYLCRLKLSALEAEGLFTPTEFGSFRKIRDWAQETETGDRAEVDLGGEDSDLWSRLDAGRDRCLGSKCRDFDRCFLTLMRQKAMESDIVVVNHHLFFADLAIRRSDAPAILPDYTAVIFDEAHELEDVASEYFGFRVSNFRILDLLNDARRYAEKSDLDHDTATEIGSALSRTQRASDMFFGSFSLIPDGRHPMPPLDHLDWPMASLRELGRLLGKQQDLFGQWEALGRRCREIAFDFDAFREGALENFVSWIERRGRGVFLEACPIDVSGMLGESLFSRIPSCVLTSATLTVGGSFDYFRRRVGMTEGRQLALATEFDLRDQTMLYLPPKMPDYRHPSYLDRSIREIHEILKASRGRAFVLFTSYRQMLTLYEAVSADSPYPCFIQERSGVRTRLLDEFRETPNAVLFATSSFWQGVDVKGEALSAVIIDKLPFQVPSDPLVSARMRDIEEDGGDPFSGYQVPNAVLRLKQGLGRLIRSRTDRGILAILDNRLTTRSYGRLFMSSLPDYAVTDCVSDLVKFMKVGVRLMRITEIFFSIQGESSHAGKPCVFVRLTGCALRCVWCDTKYAYGGGKEMSLNDVVSAVEAFPARLVELTGGEPLEQEEAYPLMRTLLDRGYDVMLETGGHIGIERVPASVIKIVDIKCPASGESHTMRWENLDLVQPHDEFKFVVRSREDYEWSCAVIRDRLAGKPNTILFSPSHEELQPAELARWILSDGIPARLQLQLHKYIWGADVRGV